LTLNATVGVFASHFKAPGSAAGVVNGAILLAAVVAIPLFPLVGAAGQRFGRRQLFLVLGALNLVVGPILLGVAVAGARGAGAVLVGGGLALLLSLLVWAVISAYLMEMFPTEIRSSGYGIAYSLPSVIPAFYPYYLIALSRLLPYRYTPLVLLAVGGLFLICGSWLSRDLRQVDLANA
jgi:MFS family permease